MNMWWKAGLPAALTVPVLAFAGGVLTSPSPEPEQREPIRMQVWEANDDPTPDAPVARTDSPPQGPSVVYPDPDDLDDVDDDRDDREHDDDDRDDRDDDDRDDRDDDDRDDRDDDRDDRDDDRDDRDDDDDGDDD